MPYPQAQSVSLRPMAVGQRQPVLPSRVCVLGEKPDRHLSLASAPSEVWPSATTGGRFFGVLNGLLHLAFNLP